jgi:hypothetical protein
MGGGQQAYAAVGGQYQRCRIGRVRNFVCRYTAWAHGPQQHGNSLCFGTAAQDVHTVSSGQALRKQLAALIHHADSFGFFQLADQIPQQRGFPPARRTENQYRTTDIRDCPGNARKIPGNPDTDRGDIPDSGDSPLLNRFSEADREGLESLVQVLEEMLCR